MARRKSKKAVEEVVAEEVQQETKEEVVAEEVQQETKEEVVAEAPKKKRGRPAKAKPDHTFSAWWGEVGSKLDKRGYSASGIYNRAKIAYGATFDDDKFTVFLENNVVYSNKEKAEAVWKSQK